ncbi:MAG TPA: TonB family protein [Steroidobacteraceae bacterium]|nr:TonB family protein [Steroidobacteraceae bacterium]
MRARETRQTPRPQAPSGDSAPLGGLACRLIERAARRTPLSLCARLEEEWLAELAVRRGRLARLRLALGCLWASQIIAHADWHGSGAVVGAVAGHRAHAGYLPPDADWVSRRTATVLLIFAVHAALIYALWAGLASKIAAVIPESIDVTFSQELRPHPQALPPPTPKMVTPQIAMPAPQVKLDLPADPTAIQTFVPRQQRAPVPPPPPRSIQHPEIRVLGGPGPGFPDSDDYYPAFERRLGRSGVTTVSVCVDREGKLTTTPTIARSSGRPGIDRGALLLAEAGSGHYRPTLDDGRPVDSCFDFLIRFILRD